MAEHSQPEMTPLAASFAEHVRAFHQSLPTDEQTLLEQVFALAEAARESAEVTGFMPVNMGAGMTKNFYAWMKSSFVR